MGVRTTIGVQNTLLVPFFLGSSLKQMASATGQSEDRLKERIDSMIRSLETKALDNIISRARDGEVDAVNWLESRGFISLPRC